MGIHFVKWFEVPAKIKLLLFGIDKCWIQQCDCEVAWIRKVIFIYYTYRITVVSYHYFFFLIQLRFLKFVDIQAHKVKYF